MKANTTLIWICVDCMLTHANGECGPSPDREPLSLIAYEDETTMGLLAEEHAEGCDRLNECDCAVRTFDSSSCEGCGSALAGERHAMTVWFD